MTLFEHTLPPSLFVSPTQVDKGMGGKSSKELEEERKEKYLKELGEELALGKAQATAYFQSIGVLPAEKKTNAFLSLEEPPDRQEPWRCEGLIVV